MNHSEKAKLFFDSTLTLLGIAAVAVICYAIGVVLTVLILWTKRDNMTAGRWMNIARAISLVLGFAMYFVAQVWILP